MYSKFSCNEQIYCWTGNVQLLKQLTSWDHCALYLFICSLSYLSPPIQPSSMVAMFSIYSGDLVFFYFPCRLDSCMPLLGSSLLSWFSGITICRLVFFALYLKTTYEWVHMIIVFQLMLERFWGKGNTPALLVRTVRGAPTHWDSGADLRGAHQGQLDWDWKTWDQTGLSECASQWVLTEKPRTRALGFDPTACTGFVGA